MKQQFNRNWDGIQRTRLEEATQSTIGKYRFTPFIEGSIKGWTISIQGTGQVGYIQEPAKKNTNTTFSPHKVYRSKDANSAYELKMSALPGTETRIISEKEIRYAPRQLLKAVAMWMDKYGKVMTEDMETTEVVAEATPDAKAKQAVIDARVRKMNTDDAVEQVKEILRSYGNDKKQREMIIAAIKNIREETAAADGAQSLNEVLTMQHFTDTSDFAKDIMAYARTLKGGKKNIGGFTDQQATLYQIAGALMQSHSQQQDFLKGLIGMLEDIHKKTMSPSKHGNMEIMRDLGKVINELKKYKKV